MREPNYLVLMIEFYNNLMESIKNSNVVIIEVRGVRITKNSKLIAKILKLKNLGIIIRESQHKNPHPEYDKNYGFQHEGNEEKYIYSLEMVNKYMQYALIKVFL